MNASMANSLDQSSYFISHFLRFMNQYRQTLGTDPLILSLVPEIDQGRLFISFLTMNTAVMLQFTIHINSWLFFPFDTAAHTGPLLRIYRLTV
jgi:hypothetical protein